MEKVLNQTKYSTLVEKDGELKLVAPRKVKPLFTKKHYEAIIKAIKKSWPTVAEQEQGTFEDGVIKLRGNLADVLGKNNPKFKLWKFIDESN